MRPRWGSGAAMRTRWSRIDMSESMKQHAVSRLVAVREPETIPAGVRGTHE